MRIALPNLGNNFIDLIKGTSLVSVISMVDLFQTGRQIASRTFEPLAMCSRGRHHLPVDFHSADRRTVGPGNTATVT